MDDLVTFATEQLALIDNELSKEVPDSGIKYYIYNYVIVTSERLGNKVFETEIHSIGPRLHHPLPLWTDISARISSNVKIRPKKRRGKTGSGRYILPKR